MARTLVSFATALLFLSATAGAQWGSGWTIPAGAEKEVNPVKADAGTLKAGKGLYDSNCARCHGPLGKGDGKDSAKDTPAADLTDEFRVTLNPDGVIFHRIMGGKPPDMPEFKSKLSAQQTWTLVNYVKSLRKP